MNNDKHPFLFLLGCVPASLLMLPACLVGIMGTGLLAMGEPAGLLFITWVGVACFGVFTLWQSAFNINTLAVKIGLALGVVAMLPLSFMGITMLLDQDTRLTEQLLAIWFLLCPTGAGIYLLLWPDAYRSPAAQT